MKVRITQIAFAIAMCAVVTLAGSATPPPAKSQAQIARGEYLVKNIGMCGDCHTPMTPTGEYVMDKWLQGKKLEFGPLVPMPVWADTSVNIAGLPGWDTQTAVKFFMTGLAPNGQPARPPMPQYKMKRSDAEAVVAYLKSLKAPGSKITTAGARAKPLLKN